jgi:hypothetical protein
MHLHVCATGNSGCPIHPLSQNLPTKEVDKSMSFLKDEMEGRVSTMVVFRLKGLDGESEGCKGYGV